MIKAGVIQAITTGYELPTARPSRLAALARAARLPMPVVMGVKDAVARLAFEVKSVREQ